MWIAYCHEVHVTVVQQICKMFEMQETYAILGTKIRPLVGQLPQGIQVLADDGGV